MLLVLAALVFALWIAIILLVDPDGFRRSSRREAAVPRTEITAEMRRPIPWYGSPSPSDPIDRTHASP
jgi:hypothetical protein